MADATTTSRIVIRLVDGPVLELSSCRIDGAGAIVTFTGAVRPTEDERPLLALHYTSYEPMAERELHRIAEQAAETHGLLHVELIHSRGRVDAGQASLQLLIAAAHRKPAIHALDQIIDALKQDVPIWKTPVYADEESTPG